MPRRRTTRIAAAIAAIAALSAVPARAVASRPAPGPAKHVLLLSIDGMHQADLTEYVSAHPASALAHLVANGTEYNDARTTFPSDSFPGMVAQLTGGGPGTTGVYYDDTYNRTLLAPGTIDCRTAVPGSEVSWTEAADRSQNPITLDAGQHLADTALSALPTNTRTQTLDDSPAITSAILKMSGTPQALLDPAALPVDPATCLPTYPHDYLRVNTVFNVARAAGLRTAWSDKHPAYEILNGPSGTGIQDLFAPEINSVADSAGDDWTTDNALTQEYDRFKVAGVLNEIDGRDHSGSTHVGTPAIFGMNFQALSTAQKLPSSDGLAGGYSPDGRPGPLVSRAMSYIDAQVQAILDRLQRDHLAKTTAVILSAKHGQSPIDPQLLRRINDGAIIDALDAAWAGSHPGAPNLVGFSVDDDVMLLWLTDRSKQAERFAQSYLLTHAAPANTITDPTGVYSTSVPASGLAEVYTGRSADRFVAAVAGDPHAPDLIGIVQHGVVYTGKTGKISEHGGDSADDNHVPLLVSGADVPKQAVRKPVLTTQIAPTILALLGLDPSRLDAVRSDHTRVLPRLRAS